ncbi:hypothetical protein GCM10010106_07080 [Thermopolyspora flexuosa]|jgi:uncharacterized membrane protein (TIGR02234 family)|uniref:Putative membrane protein (TIGR02234 family) n=1 Tax=Thermopolyspora flexuosa TaxID=103836 RepID=A0A543IZJ8_9ACTN|nr:TIGR02234 family membrane protein [Thermopolyspora flexuosa]TQM75981.1 putative membrane protein (TIGR02234 family) [Thermopolyspora flexuosa]GGM63697.1 hypothetical protein GCM10010106_07080 [Thermopolyspora flexuosa]
MTPATNAAPRRELAAWAVACALGAGLVLLAAGREWAVVRYGDSGGAALGEVALTGGELVAYAGPAALAALAAVVAVLAARGVWRRLIGAVVALCGAAPAIGVAAGLRQDAVLEAAARHSALSAAATATWETAAAWPAATVAGGIVLVAGGIVAVARAARWPGMSQRYERPDGTAARTGGADRARERGRDRERELWDAIDSGADPTADSGGGHAR